MEITSRLALVAAADTCLILTHALATPSLRTLPIRLVQTVALHCARLCQGDDLELHSSELSLDLQDSFDLPEFGCCRGAACRKGPFWSHHFSRRWHYRGPVVARMVTRCCEGEGNIRPAYMFKVVLTEDQNAAA